MNYLLNHGADVHAKTTQSETLLHCAVRCGHKEIVELLMQRGTDIHIKTRRGETLLHIAVKYGHREIVELLLQCDIDVNAKNNYSQTALYCALDRHYNKEHFTKIADLLIAHGADLQAKKNYEWFNALTNDDSAVIKMLIEQGFDINSVDEYGSTALFLASGSGNMEIVELLLAHGANVHATKDGETACMIANYVGHTEIAKLLEHYENKQN